MPNVDRIYRLKYIPKIEHDYRVQDNLADDSDDLEFFTLRRPHQGVYYFETYPTPENSGHYFYIRYYKQMPNLDSLGDTTEVPVPKLLEDYVIAQVEKVRGNENKAELYESRFRSGVGLLKREQNKIAGTQPSFLVFRGQTGWEKYHGDRAIRDDDYRERYW